MINLKKITSSNDASAPKLCLNPVSSSDDGFVWSNAAIQISVIVRTYAYIPRVVQKDLTHTQKEVCGSIFLFWQHICSSYNTKKIWIIFFCFIRSASVFPQQKSSAMFFFLGEGKNFFTHEIYIYIYIYVCVCVCVCVIKICEKLDKPKT